MTIPAGYQIHVTSWENDGDARATVTASGLTAGDIRFMIEIANFFGKAGNDFIDIEQINEVVGSAYYSAGDLYQFSPEMHRKYSGCEDPYEFICENLLGYPMDPGYYCGGEKRFCRRVESYRVFYFPEAVEDVTEKFKTEA